MTNLNGQILFKILEHEAKPLTLCEILIQVQKICGVMTMKINDEVKRLLASGVEGAFIQKTGYRYTVPPMDLNSALQNSPQQIKIVWHEEENVDEMQMSDTFSESDIDSDSSGECYVPGRPAVKKNTGRKRKPAVAPKRGGKKIRGTKSTSKGGNAQEIVDSSDDESNDDVAGPSGANGNNSSQDI